MNKYLTLILLFIFINSCNHITYNKYLNSTIHIPYSYKTNFSVQEICSLTDWYKIFNDEKLNKLVKDTIQKNIDLKIANKTIDILKYEVLKSRSNSYPNIDIEGNFIRQRQSYKIYSLNGEEKRIGLTSNRYTAKIAASYEIDLWKKISFEKEINKLEYLKSKEDREILLESIVSSIIDFYFQLSAINKKIELYNKRNKILDNLYKIYQMRYKRGITNYFQTQYYYNMLLDNTILLRNLIKQKKSLEQNINILRGNYPEYGNIETSKFNVDINTLKLPPMLPSKLLEQRPDIKKSTLDVKEAMAKVGYAHALRFPTINLSANIGYFSDKLNAFITPESKIWAISTSILYPLFNMKKLKYNEKQKKENLYKTILKYQNTVLNAFFEVENALIARKELENVYNYYLKQLKVKKDNYYLAKQRYKRGLDEIKNVYEKQLDLINLELKINDTKVAIIRNQILLFKVIGGNYTYGELKK